MTLGSRKAPIAAGLLAAAVLLAACNGGAGESPTPRPTATGSPSPSPTLSARQTAYTYNNFGISATLTPDGDEWTLKVINKTGKGIAKPGLVIRDARDGKPIQGMVEGSTPLDPGQAEEFPVTFGPGYDPDNIGLILLEFGDAEWGAFEPPLGTQQAENQAQ